MLKNLFDITHYLAILISEFIRIFTLGNKLVFNTHFSVQALLSSSPEQIGPQSIVALFYFPTLRLINNFNKSSYEHESEV